MPSRPDDELHSASEETLLELLSASDTDIRYKAAEALIKLDRKSGSVKLARFLDSSDSTLRWVICGLLSSYGDDRVTQDLIQVLGNDPAPDTRILAAFALGQIGDKRAVPFLVKARDNDFGVDFEGRSVSDAATDALKSLT